MVVAEVPVCSRRSLHDPAQEHKTPRAEPGFYVISTENVVTVLTSGSDGAMSKKWISSDEQLWSSSFSWVQQQMQINQLHPLTDWRTHQHFHKLLTRRDGRWFCPHSTNMMKFWLINVWGGFLRLGDHRLCVDYSWPAADKGEELPVDLQCEGNNSASVRLNQPWGLLHSLGHY